MGIERLPSGKFDTNALILKLSMIAYNILRIIGTQAMKKHDMSIRHKTVKHRRIHTVIERLMLIAGHLTVHSRKVFWRLDAAVRGHILSLEYLGRWQRFDLYSRLWTLLCCALFYCFLVVFSYFMSYVLTNQRLFFSLDIFLSFADSGSV